MDTGGTYGVGADAAPEGAVVVQPTTTTPPEINPWTDAATDAMSTFSVDVDSGSYTLSRRTLNEGSLPNPSEVRVEEFLNYFKYADPAPTGDLPFEVTLESAPSPFAPTDASDVQLLRIGIQAEEIPLEQRDPVNLVFLLDVSGSMGSSDKLGLVKFAMKQLVDKLSPKDTLGIVVYAGADGVVLQPTPVLDKSSILDALDNLQSGGSTNGEAGIRTAYNLAESAFRQNGINRVVLCTDGDFNVGLTGTALTNLIEDFRDRDIYLTTLGFGMGNYQDGTLEQLADHGNGNYGYIDSPNEATRMLGENLVSTLQVVAKDTKIQVEFNPATVERWRLIGYENRLLNDADFANDAVDAGDIGAGHHVTALYEIDRVDGGSGELIADVAIRYKEPNADTSTEHHWTHSGSDSIATFEGSSRAMQWAAAVTEFAEILRESPHAEGDRFGDVSAIAAAAAPEGDRPILRQELLNLVDIAAALKH